MAQLPSTRCALAAVGLFAFVPIAPAAEVPASARSVAVQTPVELLDDDNLVYAFPQHGLSLPTQLQMSTASSWPYETSVQATGANARFAQFAGLLLAHRESIGGLSSSLAQTGFAAGGSRWRVGLAVRGARARDAFERRDDIGEVVTRVEFQETTVDHAEAALGASWRGERGFVDLLVEAARQDSKISWFTASSSDTTGLDQNTDAGIRWRGALRIAAPVTDRTVIRGWGSFRDLSTSWRAVDLANSTVETYRTDLYGHEWSVAFAIEHERDDAGRTRAFARYANARPPAAPNPERFGDPRTTFREKSDRVQAGFSLERPIWWELLFLAGFQGSFEFREDVQFTRGTDGSVDQRVTTDEFLTQNFSWGLQRAIGPFDLTASLRADLALTDLFGYLDARIRFP